MSVELPRRAKHWNEREIKRLQFWWGVFSVPTIAERLGRTSAGVSEMARKLELGPFARGTMTMLAFEQMSGYHRSRIFESAKLLNMVLSRIGVGKPTKPRAKRPYGITEEQQEELLKHFAEHPGYLYPNKPGGKSDQGVWGIGRKPPACLVCGKNHRPHYAKGRCAPCYAALMRKKRKEEQDELASDSTTPSP